VNANRKLILQHKRTSAIGNDGPKNTPRKYNNSRLYVGFTFILQNGRKHLFPTRLGRLYYCCYEFNAVCGESPRQTESKNPHTSSEELLLPAAIDLVSRPTMKEKGTSQQLSRYRYFMICLKINVWCCLQIYEAYFCNVYLSSSRNKLGLLSGEFVKLLTDSRSFRSTIPTVYPSLARRRKLYWPCLW